MARRTRPISWIKAARKAFETFPRDAQDECLRALTIAAEGERADIVKPLQGLGSGIWEIVLRHRNDAFRVGYAVQIDTDLWVGTPFRRNQSVGSRRRSTKSMSCVSA